MHMVGRERLVSSLMQPDVAGVFYAILVAMRHRA
jgi:hypothetical protein